MDLATIRHVLAVADHQSFRRASQVLNTQQSAISRRIKMLERELGVPLFERTPSGARVTAAGHAFVEATRAIAVDLENAAARAVAAERGGGYLSLGFNHVPQPRRLRDLLRLLEHGSTKVEFRVVQGPRDVLITGVQSGKLDLAFICGLVPTMDLEHREVGREPIMVIASVHHPLSQATALRWHHLRGERMLVTRREPGPDLERVLREHLPDADVRRHEVDAADLASLVSVELGVALVCGTSPEVDRGDVVAQSIRSDSEPIELGLSAVWSASNANAALRSFLDSIPM